MPSVLASDAWIFQIHTERGKTQEQRCNAKAQSIYLHPECIVSRCNKVARAAQLMWRVLCAVYAAASRRIISISPVFILMAWNIILTIVTHPCVLLSFQHNNHRTPLLLAESAVQTAAKLENCSHICTSYFRRAHVAQIADYRNLLGCVLLKQSLRFRRLGVKSPRAQQR